VERLIGQEGATEPGHGASLSDKVRSAYEDATNWGGRGSNEYDTRDHE